MHSLEISNQNGFELFPNVLQLVDLLFPDLFVNGSGFHLFSKRPEFIFKIDDVVQQRGFHIGALFFRYRLIHGDYF